MAFIRVILVILIVYYSLKLIGRVVFPWLLKRWVLHMQRRYAPPGSYANDAHQQEKGRVTVHQNKTKGRRSASNEGEYVDFEEVR